MMDTSNDQSVNEVTGKNRTDSEDCGVCPGNTPVTPEEEAVLAEMRSIKDELRPLTERLHKLEARIEKPPLQETDADRNAEWAKLEGKIAQLREAWRALDERLNDAIHQKLVCLGHREPSE
jgi:DNA repair exonuclease SbcCD ATPase subunit